MADVVGACVDLVLLVLCALAAGWRPERGPAATAAGFALLLLARFALIWGGVLIGLLVPSVEVANNVYALVFPLSKVSGVFVAPGLMPDWLGALAAWNPLSATAAAIRELFGNPVAGGGSWPEDHAMALAVAWPLLLTAVFAPLAVRRFRRLSR